MGKAKRLGDAKQGDKIKIGKDKVRVASIRRQAEKGTVHVDLQGQGVRIQGDMDPDTKIN